MSVVLEDALESRLQPRPAVEILGRTRQRRMDSYEDGIAPSVADIDSVHEVMPVVRQRFPQPRQHTLYHIRSDHMEQSEPKKVRTTGYKVI